MLLVGNLRLEQLTGAGMEFLLHVIRYRAPVQEVPADPGHQRLVEPQPGLACTRHTDQPHTGDVLAGVGGGGQFDDDALRHAEVEGLEPDLHLECRM